MNNLRCRWTAVAATLCILMASAFAALAAQILTFSGNASMSKSNFAIVLGATSTGWEPSPVFRERILQGVKLYRSGIVKKIIFTGAPGKPPQARVASAYAQSLGIPGDDILLETRSMNTFENILFARELIPADEEGTVILVSDAFHLRRASLMAYDLGLQVSVSPVENSPFEGSVSRLTFLTRESLAYGYYLLKRLFLIK